MTKRMRFWMIATRLFTVLACGFSWLTVAAAQTEEITVTRNPFTSPADVSAGAKTFRSHCAPCHGLKGEGGRGPNLTTGVFFHGSSDLDLLNNISDGVAGTEMHGLLYSADHVWQIMAFIRSLTS